MRRQREISQQRASGQQSEAGQRPEIGQQRKTGRHIKTDRQRTSDWEQTIDRRQDGRYRRPRHSQTRQTHGKSSGARDRFGRLRRAVACALILFGVFVPPLIGFVALTVAALGDGSTWIATPGESDTLAAGISSGVVDPAALYPLWLVSREWSVVLVAVLVFGGWIVYAATAVRVAARITLLRL